MVIRFINIRDRIKEHNTASKIQARRYEHAKCWSYAFLARWVVLERGLKSLYDSQNSEGIRRGAIEWLDYLDGKTKEVPSKITSFTIQTQSIPPYNFVNELLGVCSSIKTAIDSREKYRRKRNRIAHKAEEFRSEKDYFVYKDAIDAAIKQLLTKLSQKIIVGS
jgi:hypothetical protein